MRLATTSLPFAKDEYKDSPWLLIMVSICVKTCTVVFVTFVRVKIIESNEDVHYQN